MVQIRRCDASVVHLTDMSVPQDGSSAAAAANTADEEPNRDEGYSALEALCGKESVEQVRDACSLLTLTESSDGKGRCRQSVLYLFSHSPCILGSSSCVFDRGAAAAGLRRLHLQGKERSGERRFSRR